MSHSHTCQLILTMFAIPTYIYLGCSRPHISIWGAPERVKVKDGKQVCILQPSCEWMVAAPWSATLTSIRCFIKDGLFPDSKMMCILLTLNGTMLAVSQSCLDPTMTITCLSALNLPSKGNTMVMTYSGGRNSAELLWFSELCGDTGWKVQW